MKLRSITRKTSAHAYLEPIMKREQYFADEIYTNLYIAINLMSGSSGNQSRVLMFPSEPDFKCILSFIQNICPFLIS